LEEKLIVRSNDTIALLHNLIDDQEIIGNTIVPRQPAMPMSALAGAKALVIVFRRKWGLIGSYVSDFGFITRKITNPDGSVNWSPPIFLHGSLYGLGFTAGHASVNFCRALLDERAVEEALKSKTSFEPYFRFLVDMDGARIRGTQYDSSILQDNVQTNKSGTTATYFIASAMLIEGSLNLGYFRPLGKWNKLLYGNASNEEILNGSVTCPGPFLPVLELIKSISDAAAIRAKRGPAVSRSASRVRGGIEHTSGSSTDTRVL
jgi:hypothetical protein